MKLSFINLTTLSTLRKFRRDSTLKTTKKDFKDVTMRVDFPTRAPLNFFYSAGIPIRNWFYYRWLSFRCTHHWDQPSSSILYCPLCGKQIIMSVGIVDYYGPSKRTKTGSLTLSQESKSGALSEL
jgi:hypothetical protein